MRLEKFRLHGMLARTKPERGGAGYSQERAATQEEK